MKTILLLLVVLLLSPVVQEVSSEERWKRYTDPTMVIDTTQTLFTPKDIFGEFSICGKPSRGRNFIKSAWFNDKPNNTPDTLSVEVFFNNKDTSVIGLWVGFSIQDSNLNFYYFLKPLFLDLPFWYPISWDLREAKKTIPRFARIAIVFMVVSKDTTVYVSVNAKTKDLKGIDNGVVSFYDNFSFDGTTSVSDSKKLPDSYQLLQNYPNPFNPSTTIKFSVPQNGHVNLTVFNLLGQEVETLVNEEREQGNHEVKFNASNLPSGIYLYRLQTANTVEAKKMILMK